MPKEFLCLLNEEPTFVLKVGLTKILKGGGHKKTNRHKNRDTKNRCGQLVKLWHAQYSCIGQNVLAEREAGDVYLDWTVGSQNTRSAP